MGKKNATSVRFMPEAERLIKELAKKRRKILRLFWASPRPQ
jgi:mRNA-degrading endonuclease RelE of RelBE toxin-antitoxin system